MSKEKSNLPDGGKRTTEHVKTCNIFGNDRSYTTTNDYDKYGNWINGTKTDHNGDIWNTDKSGNTNGKLGNDGRNR